MIVIFDSAYTGHHGEYIAHLMDGVANKDPGKYLFVISEHLRGRLPVTLRDRCRLVFVDFEEAYGNTESQFTRSKIDRDLLCDIVLKHRAQEVFFLNLDPYQHVINSRKFKRLNCSASGILFNPYVRKYNDGKFISRINKFRKILQLIWMTNNRKLESIFVLNDRPIVKELNSRFYLPSIFRFLPDPVNIEEVEKKNTSSKSYRHHLLLVAGSVSPRKNVPRIIEAVHRLGNKYQLAIIGKSSPEYEKVIEETIQMYNTVKVFRVNEFVSTKELYRYYQQASAVVVPYLDFHGSSGILNTSAYFNVPVVCGDYGLMGELTALYNLGVNVDVMSVESIAEGVRKAVDGEFPVATNYLNERTISNFQQIILGSC